MVTDLPKYMTDVLKFNIKSAGLLSALPYVAMWMASFFFGLLCDFCIKKGYHSLKNARKIYTTIGIVFCIIIVTNQISPRTESFQYLQLFILVLNKAIFNDLYQNSS